MQLKDHKFPVNKPVEKLNCNNCNNNKKMIQRRLQDVARKCGFGASMNATMLILGFYSGHILLLNTECVQ